MMSVFRAAPCRALAPSRTLVVRAFVQSKPTTTSSKVAPKAAPAPAKKAAAPAAPAEAAPKKAAAGAKAPATAKAKAVEKPKKAAKPATLRAPSAFNLFVKDQYGHFAMLPENRGKKAPEVMPQINAKWQGLSPSARAPFEATAAKLKAEVDVKRAALKAEKKANARPMNAYMSAYVAALPQLKAKNPDKKMLELAKIFKTQWDAMPAKEKEDRQAAYRAALEQWKKQHPSTK